MAGAKDSGHKSLLERIFPGDKVMWVVIVLLLIFSLFVVYSTTAYDMSANAGQELIRQIVLICLGMVGFYIAQAFNISLYKRLAAFALTLIMLLTLVMILLHKGEGAERSLEIMGLNFQPFELLKFAVIINLARQLSTRQKQMDTLRILPSFRISDWKEDKDKQLDILKNQTLSILGPIALCCLMTVKFSNSTTLIIAASSLAMMYLSRVHKCDLWHTIVIGVVCLCGALALYGKDDSRSGTAVSRLSSWTPAVMTKSVGVGSDGKEYYKRATHADGTPKEHDQTLYAKMSIATGMVFGKGAGQSTNRYLAEADKDMAYAFLIEEYGLAGGLLILFAFLLMYYRSMVIFQKCASAFPGLMVLGIGTVIVLQAFIHMLVSVSLFPLTGQQLPIVSKGGTSLILLLTMLGAVMGVSARMDEN